SVEDVGESTRLVTVVGPASAKAVAGVLGSGSGVTARGLAAMAEGDLLHLGAEGTAPLTVVRTGEVGIPAYDLLVAAEALAGIGDALREAGAAPLDAPAWDLLRIEAGRPAFGRDMDEETIPIEAGIHGRVVDYA